MPENMTAPAPVVSEPTKLPPPDPNAQGAAALKEPAEPVTDNPFEYELDVKGQKQKINFQDRAKMTAVLQKALYADQTIKESAQAIKGSETFINKLKSALVGGDLAELRALARDPMINADETALLNLGIKLVKEKMADDELSPDQREMRDLKAYKAAREAEEQRREEEQKQKEIEEKNNKLGQQIQGEIIEAMKKFPDIPQTQATMNAIMLNMSAGFRRFGKHLSAEQAMTVYAQQYWDSFTRTFEKMTPEQIQARFGTKEGRKVLDRIQQMKLEQLKGKMDPNKIKGESAESTKKKKHLTEKEFDKHFKELAGL